MKIYVSASAGRGGTGAKEAPFRTISQAARVALPGDEVVVGPGVYREWVDPQNPGRADAPIVYRAEKPLEAVITGAEVLKGWQPYEGDTWTALVDNSIFGGENPYTTLVEGDWYEPLHPYHIGEVYLNGRSLYESDTLEQVLRPQMDYASWEPEFTLYRWHCRQEGASTRFFANFQGKDPNRETVEISVRRACFAPRRPGVGYITLSGFAVRQAATQWAPPTAFQEGMVAPHWSRGWVIEDCDISEAKCCGVSLGKLYQPENDNKWLRQKYKDGTQTQRECVCLAQAQGWSGETVGHHTVRRCHIHHCGQAGIVGHMGAVFSLIEDNHIHHINTKQDLTGAETGGLKLHAASAVVFRRTHIHHCTRGLWLDWQAQGTRVTQNLFHHNTVPCLREDPAPEELRSVGEDVFVEVSHGPTLIDNNLLLSPRALKLAAQGVALAHNLVAGSIACVGTGTDNGAPHLPSPRYTPYHFPHSTQVMGFMTFLHGDVRLYNNVFVQGPVHPALRARMEESRGKRLPWDDNNVEAGAFPFDGFPTFAEWEGQFAGFCGMGSAPSDRYYTPLPVWAGGNAYFGGARPWEKEQDAYVCGEPVSLGLEERDGRLYLQTDLGQKLPGGQRPFVTTQLLGKAFQPEEGFENPDGTPLQCDEDYHGRRRDPLVLLPGPFAALGEWELPLL